MLCSIPFFKLVRSFYGWGYYKCLFDGSSFLEVLFYRFIFKLRAIFPSCCLDGEIVVDGMF